MHRPARIATLARISSVLIAALALSACGGDGGTPPPPAGVPSTLLMMGTPPPAGTAGAALDYTPAVKVSDQSGRPMAGVHVSFAASGGGTLARSTATTGADGVASAGAWTLGPEAGEQTVTARVGALTASISVRADALWSWSQAPGPPGVTQLTDFLIHPSDARLWLAANIQRGLWVSRDAGATWSQPIAAVGLDAVEIDPRAPDTVFVIAATRLHVSGDRGQTWAVRHTFPHYIRTLHASPRDGTLIAAPQWPAGQTPGVYRSEDRGITWTHHPYGVAQGQQVLTWDVEEDPETGTLWAGNEIADHPLPYRPPFLTSTDGGRTWSDATARLPFPGAAWHVTHVRFGGGWVYALSEGAGLFRSADHGATWEYASNYVNGELMIDPRNPARVYGGNLSLASPANGPGTVWVSQDRARTFAKIGALNGHSVAKLVLSPDGTRLYAATWGSGLLVAEVPPAMR